MRLTLRTLLSYLDDMLDPAQAKIIGAKVAESEQARELMERIKQVTRRRRLTTPPTSGPGGIDANTIAEYLDSDVTPEQAAEVEQICLASDVHLAEVAACHQILTLVLGEPALVPPTAKQRMYGLVKGPESIPFRKPAKPAEKKDDQDLSSEIDPEQDDTLRPGVRPGGAGNRNIWLIAGGGVLAACLLAFALIQILTPPANPGDPNPVGSLVQGDGKDDEKKAAEKKAAEKKAADARKAADQKAADQKAADQKAADQKAADEKNKEQKPIVPFPVDASDPPTVPHEPASIKQSPIGVYVAPRLAEPAVLLQKSDKGVWTPIVDKGAKVISARPLLSLSGSKNVILLETGVEVTLWGNLPELTRDWSVLESRATLFSHVAQLDADLTLERGRIILRNKKPDGKDAVIRVRFDDPTQAKEEFLDVTLYGSDSAVVLDRFGAHRNEPFFEDEKDVKRKGPTAFVKLYAYDLSATVRFGQLTRALSEMQSPMLEWNSETGKLSAVSKDKLPPWIKGIPEPKNANEKLERDPAVKAHTELARTLLASPVDVALAEIYQDVEKKAQAEMIGGKLPALDTYARWRHAIRCSAAIDDVARIYDEFSRERTPIIIRGLCMQTLQQWIAWNRGQDYALFQAVRKFENKNVSIKVLELLHPVTTEAAGSLATYQHLAEGLNNDVLAIRTLSHWHLLLLVPGGLEIRYDPVMPRVDRANAVLAWNRLITPKKDKK